MIKSKMNLSDMDLSRLILQTREPVANPGGGAILILTSNLAINLSLMMDKKDYLDKNKEANVSRETLLNISEEYEKLMQDDVEYFNKLMDSIKAKSDIEEDYINAAKPLINMVDKNLEALGHINFFIKNGKKSTSTDGQIANDLLYQATISAFPTIKLNLAKTNYKFDYKQKENQVNKLYKKNLETFERR